MADFVCASSYKTHDRVRGLEKPVVWSVQLFTLIGLEHSISEDINYAQDVDCFDLFCGEATVSNAFRRVLTLD